MFWHHYQGEQGWGWGKEGGRPWGRGWCCLLLLLFLLFYVFGKQGFTWCGKTNKNHTYRLWLLRDLVKLFLTGIEASPPKLLEMHSPSLWPFCFFSPTFFSFWTCFPSTQMYEKVIKPGRTHICHLAVCCSSRMGLGLPWRVSMQVWWGVKLQTQSSRGCSPLCLQASLHSTQQWSVFEPPCRVVL